MQDGQVAVERGAPPAAVVPEAGGPVISVANAVDEAPPELLNKATEDLINKSVNVEAARTILEIKAAGGEVSQLCDMKAREFQLQAVKIEGDKVEVTDPQKIALSLDIEIAGAKYKLGKLEEKRGKKSQPTDDEKALADRVKKLEKQRADGKVKMIVNGKEIEVDCQELKTQPDDVIEMAKSLCNNLGFRQEQIADLLRFAEGNPLAAIDWLVHQAAIDPKLRKGLIANLKNSNQFGEGEEKLAVIDLLDKKVIEPKAKVEKGKKVATIAAKGAGITGLMMILMMWISREKKQGMG